MSDEILSGIINAAMAELGLPAGSCEDEFLEAVTRLAEQVRELEGSWRCFHCGEVFTDAEKAREHFGDREKAEAVACVLETTHPLVIRLRVRIAALEEDLAGERARIRRELLEWLQQESAREELWERPADGGSVWVSDLRAALDRICPEDPG